MCSIFTLEKMKDMLLGNTPLVQLENMFVNNKVFAKLEYYNPTFSVKDRAAYNMIYEGIKNGYINKDSILVEATSGNTGLGLCYAAIKFDLQLIVTVFDDVPKEKINLLKAFGAYVVICSSKYESTSDKGYVGVAKKIAREIKDAIYVDQFNNIYNVEAHYKYTGPELYKQMNNKIDYFFATIGTGGTISGIGRYIKEKNEKVKIIGVEPVGGIYRSNFYKEEERYMDHLIQSISDDFISPNFKKEYVDDIIQVPDIESFSSCYEIMYSEGLCVGTSGGCVIAAIKRYIEQNKIQNSNIACIIPDNGLKYIDTLFNEKYLADHQICIKAKNKSKCIINDYFLDNITQFDLCNVNVKNE